MARSVVIVLDTHAWVWWVSRPDALSPRALAHIRQADRALVSAISCWEVAMLVAKGRLVLDRDVLLWLRQALAVRPVDLAPLTPEIAARSAALGIEFPGDPADRIIAATARQHRAPLVTRDARLQRVTDLVTVW